jgi:hypothetical protein
MSRKIDPKKVALWRDHIEKLKEYKGTQVSFCKEREISVRNFNYWKYRFKKESSLALKISKPGSFLPVQVKAERVRSVSDHTVLPDAKWVSEIIFELSRRFA